MSDRPKVRVRPSRWHLPLWYLNILAAGLMLLMYAGIHVRPSTFWPAALLVMLTVGGVVSAVGGGTGVALPPPPPPQAASPSRPAVSRAERR